MCKVRFIEVIQQYVLNMIMLCENCIVSQSISHLHKHSCAPV